MHCLRQKVQFGRAKPIIGVVKLNTFIQIKYSVIMKYAIYFIKKCFAEK